MLRKIKTSIAVCTVALFTACGGGGGGGDVVVTPAYTGPSPTLNLQSAWDNLLSVNSLSNFTISGTGDSSAASGSGTLAISTLTNQTVSSTPNFGYSLPTLTNLSGAKLNYTFNLPSGAGTFDTSWLYDTNGELKRITSSAEAVIRTVESYTRFPTAVTAGDSGTILSATTYTIYAVSCGTYNADYIISSKSATALKVTMTLATRKIASYVVGCLGAPTTGTEVIEFELTSTGLRFIKDTDTDTGGSQVLTFN